jgi:hypothetical protein
MLEELPTLSLAVVVVGGRSCCGMFGSGIVLIRVLLFQNRRVPIALDFASRPPDVDVGFEQTRLCVGLDMDKPLMVRRRLLNALFPIGLDALKVHLMFIVLLISTQVSSWSMLWPCTLTLCFLNTLISPPSFILLYHEHTIRTGRRRPLFATLRPVSSII